MCLCEPFSLPACTMMTEDWRLNILLYYCCYAYDIKYNSTCGYWARFADADAERMRILLCSSAKGSNYGRFITLQLLWIFYIEGCLALWCRGLSINNWKGVIRTGIHTCVLCKFWITNKRLWELSWQLLVSSYTNHVVLISSLSKLNQPQHVTMRVSSVAAYWSRTCGIPGSNSLEI
jgi:hypothetical protein